MHSPVHTEFPRHADDMARKPSFQTEPARKMPAWNERADADDGGEFVVLHAVDVDERLALRSLLQSRGIDVRFGHSGSAGARPAAIVTTRRDSMRLQGHDRLANLRRLLPGVPLFILDVSGDDATRGPVPMFADSVHEILTESGLGHFQGQDEAGVRPSSPARAAMPAVAAPSPARLPFAPPAPRLLWSGFGSRNAKKPLAGLRVLVMGLSGSELMLVREELRHAGARPVAVADVDPLSLELPQCQLFDAAIVNFDLFEDIGEGVDALMAFRVACPNVTVVLVSKKVRADDPGAERRMICDATLRSPFTPARFSAAVSAAIENSTAPRRS